MAMTKKQHKALARHKRIVRKRNIRTNNVKGGTPMLFAPGTSKSYRLYEI